ncbi:MAG: UPF0158 family protein [Clostridium sp.]|nr:UPF0158 family protein [Clostridium sp.]MDU7084814.1 UPF0158 family protein [Clostridium sp.]
MNKLSIDMNLLLELSLMETRGEGECYISLKDGEFSYIPQSIIAALKDESLFSSLESWERELAKEAENIVMNYSELYLYIPIIEDEVLIGGMKAFVDTLTKDEKANVEEKVDFKNPFLSFSKVLTNINKLDDYYDFRDKYLKNYLVNWLVNNKIEVA